MILLGCWLSWSVAEAACTGSSPTWTSSADSASITSCLSSAASGDTINVGAGTCTTCNFTLTKSVHLTGAGSGSSTISGSITITPTVAESTKVIEVSGFTFSGGGPYFNGAAPDTSHPVTSLKVHDNIITGATVRSVFFTGNLSGLVWGVFYSNAFSNNGLDISMIEGDTNGCFLFAPAFGSSQYLYFEDNTFTNTGNNFIFETGQCGRIVFRHSTVTGNGSLQEIFDLHGEQNSGGWTVGAEIYENNITMPAAFRWVNHRGGQAVVMNNTLSKLLEVDLTEYTAWGGNGICYAYPVAINAAEAYCSPINGTTCREAQVHNSFYFNNHFGGSQASVVVGAFDAASSCSGNTSAMFIQLNREYFAPTFGLESAKPGTCTIGDNYGTTDTDKIFNCTSTNVWTVSYTPYTYPHPLRGAVGGAPALTVTGTTSLTGNIRFQ